MEVGLVELPAASAVVHAETSSNRGLLSSSLAVDPPPSPSSVEMSNSRRHAPGKPSRARPAGGGGGQRSVFPVAVTVRRVSSGETAKRYRIRPYDKRARPAQSGRRCPLVFVAEVRILGLATACASRRAPSSRLKSKRATSRSARACCQMRDEVAPGSIRMQSVPKTPLGRSTRGEA